MKSIWIATLDTRSFSFEAYGDSHDAARAALMRGLARHAEVYRLSPDWFEPGNIEVRGAAFGAAYRDRQLI